MKLKVGIIGSGLIASKHAAILKNRDDVEVAAVVDILPGKAAEFIKKRDLNGANGYEVFSLMLESEDLDALYFCIPPFSHGREVEEAAAKGIHVFLEKPIALDSAKAERMVSAIEDNSVISQVGFHMRFFRGVKLLREKMAEGLVGRPLLMSSRYWANFQGPDWWKDVSRSGGQVFEQVCHLYDLSRFFLGEPRRVHGALANLTRGAEPDYTVEDTSCAIVVFENGGMASFTGCNNALPDRFIGDFRIVCERAVLELHSTGDWRDKEVSKLYLHDGSKIQDCIELVEDGDPYGEETEDFIRAIKSKEQSTTPAREGLKTIQLIERVLADAKAVNQPVAAE